MPSFTFSAQRSKRCLTLRDGYVQGVLLWNGWEQLDAARELIAELRLFRPAELHGRGRATADGRLFAEHLLDELFLTLAPQVAGRDASVERPGLVALKQFAPEHPLWRTLLGVKRAGRHLFLRYAFEARG